MWWEGNTPVFHQRDQMFHKKWKLWFLHKTGNWPTFVLWDNDNPHGIASSNYNQHNWRTKDRPQEFALHIPRVFGTKIEKHHPTRALCWLRGRAASRDQWVTFDWQVDIIGNCIGKGWVLSTTRTTTTMTMKTTSRMTQTCLSAYSSARPKMRLRCPCPITSCFWNTSQGCPFRFTSKNSVFEAIPFFFKECDRKLFRLFQSEKSMKAFLVLFCLVSSFQCKKGPKRNKKRHFAQR